MRKLFELDFTHVSIISKTQKTMIHPAFNGKESILFEGKSILTGNTRGEIYGFSSYGSFKYDLKKWINVKRTTFYYALNGRSKETGIIDKLECIKFSDRVILVPLQNVEPFREFLES